MTVSKPLKYLLFAFNFLFLMGGAIILGFSVHVRCNSADYRITDELLPSVNLLIFVGAVALILGFLGCRGAIRENRCLLVPFFLGLLVTLLMQIQGSFQSGTGSVVGSSWDDGGGSLV